MMGVRTAKGGRKDPQLAREQRPGLITLDVLMPELDGWAVLSALQTDPELCNAPVVTQAEGEDLGRALGATAYMHKPLDYDEHIPMTFTAFGPNSLALGGRAFDAVVLHTFFTDETTVRCVRAVKQAAKEAGRDPASVRVWSCFATIGDHLPEDLRRKKTVGHMATYLQGYGDLMVTFAGPWMRRRPPRSSSTWRP